MTPKRVIEKRSSSAPQRLPVLAEELVEQAPPGRVGEGPEHVVHPVDNR